MFRNTMWSTILLTMLVMAGCVTIFSQLHKAALMDARTEAAIRILSEFHVDYVQDPIRYQAQLSRLAKEHPDMFVIEEFLADVEAAIARGGRNELRD